MLVLEASLRILSDVFGGCFNYSCLTSLYPFALIPITPIILEVLLHNVSCDILASR